MADKQTEYATSTRTFVVYSGCIAPVDLNTAYAKALVFKPLGGEILSIKYGQTENQSNSLKCLTLSLKFGHSEEPQPPPTSLSSRRGRKTTRKKVDGKLLSVKLFRNGSTQVTGCKTIEHVKFSMNTIYTLLALEHVQELNVVSIMNNINFSIGFKIDREKLGNYLAEQGVNVPPITTGYMGIKIRLDSLVEKQNLMIPRFVWEKATGFTNLNPISYLDFFAHDEKKIGKKLTVCVGIFQNGKILMTCVDDLTTQVMFDHVRKLLTDARPHIEMQERVLKTFRR